MKGAEDMSVCFRVVGEEGFLNRHRGKRRKKMIGVVLLLLKPMFFEKTVITN